jgi:translation initiation factor 2 subunit 2
MTGKVGSSTSGTNILNTMLLHFVLARKMKYNYDELLKRACSQMPEVSLKVERLELPRLFISTIGMRTVISNFKDVASAFDRDPQHILKYLTREMATAATYHEGRAIFQGKFRHDSFERLLQRYMESFVTCPVCKRPDTKIVKEKRLTFLVCKACGARSSVKQL